ncbi:MAG: ComF family protein [Lachnospiraceae bacterium]|nr:ComF family protein [Lachnospiraceae bacterium]
MEWNLWEKGLEVLYPPKCPFCNEIRELRGSKICGECFRELPVRRPPFCLKCGKPVEREEYEFCYNCRNRLPEFDRAYPMLLYRKKVPEVLARFKYKNDRQIGRILIQELGKETMAELKLLRIDGIVPVPMYWKKEKARGYNQAYLLAKEIGKILERPVYKNYLVRTISTAAQKELSESERKKNIKKAFKMGKNVVKLNHILLVDDIYTTGATVSACTSVLKEAGTKKVYVTCIGIGTDVM